MLCPIYFWFSLSFLRLKESTFDTRENVFYFTSKALLVLKILEFLNFKFHDVIN